MSCSFLRLLALVLGRFITEFGPWVSFGLNIKMFTSNVFRMLGLVPGTRLQNLRKLS